MQVQELLVEWRKTYAEWISTELQLRAVRRQKNSGPLVPVLEEKIRGFKRQCSECQDALSLALALERGAIVRDEPSNAEQHAGNITSARTPVCDATT